MSELPAVLYLEADDEVTSVIRRVRAAETDRVVVVVPGRSRATSSTVALRLLARAGEESGCEVSVVGDALTRSLVAEAGLPAYATLADANRAEPPPGGEPTEVRHAAIHVVRGSEETVATPAIVEAEVTRPVAVLRRRPSAATRRRRALVPLVVVAVSALLALGLVGAAVLPGATVTIAPLTQDIGPVPFVVEVERAEQLSGTAEASATVTATGDYESREPATGTVLLRNWSPFDQPIAAGTLVAAGEQAFATDGDVVVPAGSLTGDGRILAGEVPVGVTAAATGPEGNVEAGAIDTVLSQGADARLRGFGNNNERRVINPEATSGGIDAAGVEITQTDVDAAVDALTADLRGQVADAMAEHADAIVVQPDLGEPAIEGLEDLVGTRDQEEATLEGRLPWEAWTADRDEVMGAARADLPDGLVLPAGYELLPDSIEIAVEEANVEGGVMRVDVTVSGRSATAIDSAEVARRVAGLTADEAEAVLADLGDATVELWPGWVGSVPGMAWRIEVRVVEP